MMADFMRNHVRLREIAGGLEPVLQFVEERQVYIDLAVARAVEGAHGGLAGAAGRGRGAAKQHQLGLDVLAVQLLLEDAGPHVFGFAQDLGHEDRLGIVGWRGRGGRLLLHGRAFRHVQDHARIDAEVHRHQGKYYRAYANGPAAADSWAAGTAVFHIVALARIIEAHTGSPGGSSLPPFCIAALLGGLQGC